MLLLNDVIERNFTQISDSYRTYAHEKDKCRQCSVYDHYCLNGQSEGNANDPTFMIIGEGMGRDECVENRPFVGKAGQRLRTELRKHRETFNRKTALISNVLGCRPKDNKFPQDRDLVNNCADNWIRREIKLVKPKIILTLGGPSLEYIRGQKGITKHRGTWEYLSQYSAWSFATYHPSYVLRLENTEKKDVVVDFETDIHKVASEWSLYVNELKLGW